MPPKKVGKKKEPHCCVVPQLHPLILSRVGSAKIDELQQFSLAQQREKDCFVQVTQIDILVIVTY